MLPSEADWAETVTTVRAETVTLPLLPLLLSALSAGLVSNGDQGVKHRLARPPLSMLPSTAVRAETVTVPLLPLMLWAISAVLVPNGDQGVKHRLAPPPLTMLPSTAVWAETVTAVRVETLTMSLLPLLLLSPLSASLFSKADQGIKHRQAPPCLTMPPWTAVRAGISKI